MPRNQNLRENPSRKINHKCGGIVYSCEKCNHTVELHVTAKVDKTNVVKEPKKPRQRRNALTPDTPLDMLMISLPTIPESDEKTVVMNPSVLPIYAKVTHKGHWVTDESTKLHMGTMDEKCNRNSVMLTNDCLLYKLKLAIRHRFICLGLIEPHDIDPQNLVPHIVVRKSPGDSNSQFHPIQGEVFKIDEADLSVKSQFLLIELDRTRDLHMTMIFSKGLKQRCDMVVEFKEMLAMLLDPKYQHLLQEYADLPYFGQDAVSYWKETKDQYPMNVTPPPDWKPTPKKGLDLSGVRLSAIGSVLE